MITQVPNPISDVLTLTVADTEYSFTLPKGTQYAEARARTANSFRIAYQAGKVAGSTNPYQTVASGGTWKMPAHKVLQSNLTVYCASGTAGLVVEIDRWP